MGNELRTTGAPVPQSALGLLVGGIVDYAGLFPPAGLTMPEAVENYAAYRRSADAWMLGRFVVPAERLQELADSIASRRLGSTDAPWSLSVLLGPPDTGGLDRVRPYAPGASGALSGAMIADVVEFRAETAEDIETRLPDLPPGVVGYVEIPWRTDPQDLVTSLRRTGGRAKIRTGGVSPDLFPPATALLRFIRACVALDLPFKATAGLHHPLAGSYPLTYEQGSPPANMYGFLNLLVATALLRAEAPEDIILEALEEQESVAFHFADDFARWRDHRFGRDAISAARRRGMVAFGSCSFREPVEELAAIIAGGTDSSMHTAEDS